MKVLKTISFILLLCMAVIFVGCASGTDNKETSQKSSNEYDMDFGNSGKPFDTPISKFE